MAKVSAAAAEDGSMNLEAFLAIGLDKLTAESALVNPKVKYSLQLDVALSFLSNAGPESFNVNEFEEACGVACIYNKDDFFDTLSCNYRNRGGWNGRTRLSERMKLDTQTFGEFQRTPPQGPHANYGVPHSGYYRGSYNQGKSYGCYGGRGRGGYNRPF